MVILLFKLVEWFDTWFCNHSSQQSAESAGRMNLLPQISITDSSADPKLIEWLQSLHLDQGSIDKVSGTT
jgi:hypothetical protein